jgi:hypothetical protein
MLEGMQEARVLLNHPVIFAFLCFILLWIAAQAGAAMRKQRPLQEEERDDFGLVEGATLTLLGLIIGFSFSMATTRYDQRKNYEEAEANAIGTEYVRIDLLPKADAATIRNQLHRYTELRIAFYRTRRGDELDRINAETAALQTKMWEAVEAPSLAQPTPIAALAVAGMNDVLNSQGYTQAAWWNRIPSSAWALMIAIAVAGNFLVGYGARGAKTKGFLLFVLPLVVAISFLLIADIDSPRGGFIHVVPQNLQSVLQSMPAQ